MPAFSTAARTCATDAIGWVASGRPVAGLMTVIERVRALGFFGDGFLVGLFFGVTRNPPTRCHGVLAQYPLRASTPYGWTACVGTRRNLISTRAIKAARAWVAQLGQRRSVEVAVPQGFAGSNPAPRIFDWAQRIGAAVTISFYLPTPASLTDEPTTRIRHQDREGDDRGLERPGSRVGQGLGHAHSFDRLNFVGIGAAARRMALPREEHLQGPLQVGRETVPREHLEKTSGFVARLLQQLAARARLRRFAVARGAAGQRMGDPSQAVTVLSRQDDFFLARHREDRGGRAEVHPDPTFVSAARQHDLVLGDGRPCVSDPFRRDGVGFGSHRVTRSGRVMRVQYLAPSQSREPWPDPKNATHRGGSPHGLDIVRFDWGGHGNHPGHWPPHPPGGRHAQGPRILP